MGHVMRGERGLGQRPTCPPPSRQLGMQDPVLTGAALLGRAGVAPGCPREGPWVLPARALMDCGHDFLPQDCPVARRGGHLPPRSPSHITIFVPVFQAVSDSSLLLFLSSSLFPFCRSSPFTSLPRSFSQHFHDCSGCVLPKCIASGVGTFFVVVNCSGSNLILLPPPLLTSLSTLLWGSLHVALGASYGWLPSTV